MKQKTTDFFENVSLSEIAGKLLSSKRIQPVLNRSFEQMMKFKSRLDAVMPMALSLLNMPSVEDIKRLNNEVVRLGSMLAEMSQKFEPPKKVRRKRTARKARLSVHASQKGSQDTAPAQDIKNV